MERDNRPRSREKNVTGQKGSVQKRGAGQGSGPVGTGRPGGNGPAGGGRPGGNVPGGRRPAGGGSSHRGLTRAGGFGGGAAVIIAILVYLLGGGGGSTATGSGSISGGAASAIVSMLGSGSGSSGGTGTASGTWSYKNNTGVLNTEVADAAAEKRTVIRGDGTDTVTIMVYMCGADLESRSAMATKDLQEMLAASLSDQVNLIVYTGGAKTWKNNVVSSSVNQIYQVKNGGLVCLEENAGSGTMTDPDNLTSFISYCEENFPANRRDLIFWNHGGGSVSGYGYDENHPKSGSMSLSGINTALKNAGVTFDFIGFDACLMATVENALMLDDYADYLIASEETEPGIGWYYTDWLTKLSADTSMSTLEIGKNIVDDFVAKCASSCPGQKTTLSVTDLAEVAATVPSVLNTFSTDTTAMIKNDEYAAVSDARYGAREFSRSSKINQIDMVHMARRLNTDASNALADALLSAVKYNKTSADMTNAYGLSVYFPAGNADKVDSAVAAYSHIGMDASYSQCIKAAAAMSVSGQAAAGGTSSALPQLLSAMTGTSSSSSYGDLSALTSLAGSLLTGSLSGRSIDGLNENNTEFLADSGLDSEAVTAYLNEHHIDAEKLVWSEGETPVLSLTEEEWSLVKDLELSVYYDDGAGFIDLGLDNVFSFDEEGNLIGTYDNTWLAIEGQPVAYYYDSTVDDGEHYTITGHVPALLNDERVNLILVFDNENPNGYIAGASYVYDGETETVGKSTEALEEGDTLDFLCDYYSYDGDYEDSYLLGEQITYAEDMEISNVEIGDSISAMYRITDIYGQNYWTETMR